MSGSQNGKRPTLEQRIGGWHETLQREYSSLCRIAIALYESASDVLSTYVYSSTDPSPLTLYQAKLADVPSLGEIAKTGVPRVINDLSVLAESSSKHTQRIVGSGLRSSLTVPIYGDDGLFGFLFYNSKEEGFFSEAVLLKLRIYTDLISFVALEEARPIRTLRAAVNTARSFAQHRDSETGKHLERMSRYARLIARQIAHQHELTDTYLELIFQLAPLHDVGKIAVPDDILLKRGQLTDEEYAVMKSHVPKGIEIVEMLIQEFGLQNLEYGQMLKHIVAYHHEDYAGSGYPAGIAGDEIPLEARITRVADVFDALTSDRPYKKAWSNDEAVAELRAQSGKLFDPECVDALIQALDEVVEIQALFAQDYLG